jgi:hypothetical protein
MISSLLNPEAEPHTRCSFCFMDLYRGQFILPIGYVLVGPWAVITREGYCSLKLPETFDLPYPSPYLSPRP